MSSVEEGCGCLIRVNVERLGCVEEVSVDVSHTAVVWNQVLWFVATKALPRLCICPCGGVKQANADLLRDARLQ